MNRAGDLHFSALLFELRGGDDRVYLYCLDTITAVQTDVLPPNVRGCWQHRCNALANMSIAPYPG